MARSSLCTYVNITGNHSSGRAGCEVCKVTPHYMAARWTGRQCADYFASTARQASSNYCIGVGGDIAMSVDESDRAWTSSSAWNDRRAITIECGNVDNSTGEMTAATWDSLVALCVDICKRYGFRLSYTGDRDGSLTEHRMFASTDCPGAWLHARMGQLADEVNAALDGPSAAWVKGDGGRWWYRHADGSWTSGGWEMVDGRWYLFDGQGWMLTGWQRHDGQWYLLGDDGAMLTGWQQVSGRWYYLTDTGAMATGWQMVDGTWYYTDPDTGEMVTGWRQVDGSWYWMDPATGAMASSTAVVQGSTVYVLDASGRDVAAVDLTVRAQ